MTMQRTDLATQLKNEAMRVMPELQSEYYNAKKNPPFYTKFTTVKKLSDMEWSTPKMGGGSAYTQMVSLIGVTELIEREEGAPITYSQPILGFPIWIKRKNFVLGTKMTMEVNRDFKAIKKDLMDWLKTSNFPEAVETTKEKYAIGLINEGAFTAGSNYYNNNIPGITPTTYGNTVYDGLPLFNLAGNLRTNKSGSTFYTHIGDLPLTIDNLKTGDILLKATNAYREDNQPFNNDLDNFIMTNHSLDNTVDQIINSTLIPGNNNNDKNPLYNRYKPISNPYMTPSTAQAWVIGNKHGFWFFDSNDIVIDVWQDYERKILCVSASIDLAAAIVNWRSFVCSYLPRS